jgi:hypothetical protein
LEGSAEMSSLYALMAVGITSFFTFSTVVVRCGSKSFDKFMDHRLLVRVHEKDGVDGLKAIMSASDPE